MTLRRLLLSGAVLALSTLAARAQEAPNPDYTPTTSVARKVISYPRTSVGFTGGWGAPYGWGVDISQMIMPSLDVNAGMGLGVGWKIGVGARYYFTPQKRVSPFAGVNISRTSGINDMELTVETGSGYSATRELVRFSIAPSMVIHARGGVRCQFRKIGLIGALGYGIHPGSDPLTYTSGYEPAAQSTRDVMNAITPGGFELSAGITLRIAD
jgi:hypothetical protein